MARADVRAPPLAVARTLVDIAAFVGYAAAKSYLDWL
jgi:hypothetical protein